MKRWTQTILSWLFAIAVLFSSTHAVVNYHLCQETVKTYGVFAPALGCSMSEMQGQCSSADTKQDGLKKRACCQNLNFTFHESDYEYNGKLHVPSPVVPSPVYTHYFEVKPVDIDREQPIVYKPPNPRVDIQTAFQVFLI